MNNLEVIREFLKDQESRFSKDADDTEWQDAYIEGRLDVYADLQKLIKSLSKQEIEE